MIAPRTAHTSSRRPSTRSTTEGRAVHLMEQVCAIAGDMAMIDNVRAECDRNGVAAAVQRHDDGPLFDWLVAAFSFQGISDVVARSYWLRGGVTQAQVDAGLADARCPKLASFWTFERCGYQKGAWYCGEPNHRADCPLPLHDLRNGRLNQGAYSLRLFLRDLCDDDLVGWIDRRLEEEDCLTTDDRVLRLGQAVIEPMKGVFGVSDKVLNMVLADLLIGGDPNRSTWVAAGGGMIAIDTLVHNWLHRTGILGWFGGSHAYGDLCYGATGCAALLRRFSSQIDARRFNLDHPPDFPRFVQHAIWRFCAMDHEGRCNGVKIDDRRPCKDPDCPVGGLCARTPLAPGRLRGLNTMKRT